jgi:hypothetical protein
MRRIWKPFRSFPITLTPSMLAGFTVSAPAAL